MNLTQLEEKIVAARESGIAICDLDETGKSVAATSIVFRIGVITGCQLPTNPMHVEMLEFELLKFINEYGYATLTTEEILTAFRMNANLEFDKKIELYGAIFNIDLVGKVISQYLDHRSKLDNKLIEKFQLIQSEKEENDRQQNLRIKIQDQFEKYLESSNGELDLSDCYRQLAKDGAFKDRMFFKEFYNEVKKELEVGEKLDQPTIHSIYEKWELDFAAEKLAVRCLFENMQDMGQTKIYDSGFKIIQPGLSLPKTERVADDF